MIYVSRIRLFIGEKKSRGTGAREIHLGSSIPTSLRFVDNSDYTTH